MIEKCENNSDDWGLFIPSDKMNETIGKHKIAFGYGTRKRYKTDVNCGDYVIKWNSERGERDVFSDEELAFFIKEKIDENEFTFDELIAELRLTREYSEKLSPDTFISIKSIMKNISSESLRLAIYCLWHRGIVEERIYPSIDDLGGRYLLYGTYLYAIETCYNKAEIDNLFRLMKFRKFSKEDFKKALTLKGDLIRKGKEF